MIYYHQRDHVNYVKHHNHQYDQTKRSMEENLIKLHLTLALCELLYEIENIRTIVKSRFKFTEIDFMRPPGYVWLDLKKYKNRDLKLTSILDKVGWRTERANLM